jgi:hypothetical protein
MRDDHRFASLNAAGRKWLTEDPDLGAEPARDAGARPQAWLDLEPDHDGWKPIVSRQALARLGDVLRLRLR